MHCWLKYTAATYLSFTIVTLHETPSATCKLGTGCFPRVQWSWHGDHQPSSIAEFTIGVGLYLRHPSVPAYAQEAICGHRG